MRNKQPIFELNQIESAEHQSEGDKRNEGCDLNADQGCHHFCGLLNECRHPVHWLAPEPAGQPGHWVVYQPEA